jgi:hypothetical protein
MIIEFGKLGEVLKSDEYCSINVGISFRLDLDDSESFSKEGDRLAKFLEELQTFLGKHLTYHIIFEPQVRPRSRNDGKMNLIYDIKFIAYDFLAKGLADSEPYLRRASKESEEKIS